LDRKWFLMNFYYVITLKCLSTLRPFITEKLPCLTIIIFSMVRSRHFSIFHTSRLVSTIDFYGQFLWILFWVTIWLEWIQKGLDFGKRVLGTPRLDNIDNSTCITCICTQLKRPKYFWNINFVVYVPVYVLIYSIKL